MGAALRVGRALAAAVAAVALATTSCAALEDGLASDDGARVVATTPVLAELARGVLGDDVRIDTLVPSGVDPHEMRFSELQLDAAADATLLVAGGRGLERGLEELLEHVEGDDDGDSDGDGDGDGPVVFVAAEHVREPFESLGGQVDPHFWHDPEEMGEVARALGSLVAEVEELDVEHPRRAAGEFARSLVDVRLEVDALLRTVPERRRGLLTQHDFFRYLARAFDLSVVGTVVPGSSSAGQPSASERLSLLETVEERGTCAIFTPESSGETLTAVVAREASVAVEVVPVFADTLGPGMDYRETLLENARRVASALTSCG